MKRKTAFIITLIKIHSPPCIANFATRNFKFTPPASVAHSSSSNVLDAQSIDEGSYESFGEVGDHHDLVDEDEDLE